MGKQTFQKAKKTMTLLLLVSVVVALTIASVSAARSSGGGSGPTRYSEKEQAPSEKSVCECLNCHGAPQEFQNVQCCCGPGKICDRYPDNLNGACGFDKNFQPIYCRGKCVPLRASSEKGACAKSMKNLLKEK